MPPKKEDFRVARHMIRLNDANHSALKMQAEREDMSYNQVIAEWIRDSAASSYLRRERNGVHAV
jgi:predicted HicB family RNase H-like nuclease